MMKSKVYLIVGLLAMCGLLEACKSPSTAAFYTFETECVTDVGDGSVVVRAWGQGASRADATEQAKRRAMHDIIFKGLQKGSCQWKPLLFEVNAEEKHQEYFNRFFAKGGDYADFIKMDATKSGSGVKAESKTRDSYGLVVRVLRADLEKRLIEDQILVK